MQWHLTLAQGLTLAHACVFMLGSPKALFIVVSVNNFQNDLVVIYIIFCKKKNRLQLVNL